jgi:hypothetical protein
MNTAVSAFVRSWSEFIRQLVVSNQRSHYLPSEWLARGRIVLQRMLVDGGLLRLHVDELTKQFQGAFRYRQPRRFRPEGEAPGNEVGPSVFLFHELWAEADVLPILEQGVGEEVIPDFKLPELLLNPYALWDIYDQIDFFLPTCPYWMPVMSELGRGASEANSDLPRPNSLKGNDAKSQPILARTRSTRVPSWNWKAPLDGKTIVIEASWHGLEGLLVVELKDPIPGDLDFQLMAVWKTADGVEWSRTPERIRGSEVRFYLEQPRSRINEDFLYQEFLELTVIDQTHQPPRTLANWIVVFMPDEAEFSIPTI